MITSILCNVDPPPPPYYGATAAPPQHVSLSLFLPPTPTQAIIDGTTVHYCSCCYTTLTTVPEQKQCYPTKKQVISTNKSHDLPNNASHDEINLGQVMSNATCNIHSLVYLKCISPSLIINGTKPCIILYVYLLHSMLSAM